MYKKVICALLFGFLIIGAASAANDFKINDGFDVINEYHSINEENDMHLCIWDYDDEIIQESYLQNDTGYRITPGENNTYNTTYNGQGILSAVMSYIRTCSIPVDHGILEVAEVNGDKYIFYTYIEYGSEDDWQICYDELMKFNENNNITPLADVI